MPEFPDVEIYVERLTDFVGGKRLQRIRFNSPFVLRSVEPPIGDAHNRMVERVSRLGKQIVITLEDDLHDEMAVHGRYGEPCPVCNAPVQRIVFADNEANYCAHCQTGGKLLADRALSRLLKKNWPRTLEELD